VERRHHGACKSRLRSVEDVFAELTRAVDVGITKVATHEKVRALKIISWSISFDTVITAIRVTHWAGSIGSRSNNCMIGGGSTGFRSANREQLSAVPYSEKARTVAYLFPSVQQRLLPSLDLGARSECRHRWVSSLLVEISRIMLSSSVALTFPTLSSSASQIVRTLLRRLDRSSMLKGGRGRLSGQGCQ